MKIYVVVTEEKVHTYTSWSRATQVSLRAERRFRGQRFTVVQTVTQKRKATQSEKAITEQLFASRIYASWGHEACRLPLVNQPTTQAWPGGCECGHPHGLSSCVLLSCHPVKDLRLTEKAEVVSFPKKPAIYDDAMNH